MQVKDLFNDSTLAEIKAVLDAATVNNGSITRVALANKLGLASSLEETGDGLSLSERYPQEAKAKQAVIESVLGALISLEVIPGFESRRGPGGGIVKSNSEKSEKKSGINFPPNFLENLEKTLTRLIPEKNYKFRITRAQCAQEMGLPGSDTETLLSKVFADKKLPGFLIKKGMHGGIGRDESCPVSSNTIKPNVLSQVDSSFLEDSSNLLSD